MTKAWRLIAMATSVATLTVGAVRAADSDVPEAGKEPWAFGLSTRVDYTDNRDSTETDEESTFDFYITPRIDLYASGDAATLDLRYEPSFRYRENPSDTQNDWVFPQDLNLLAGLMLSDRTKLRLIEHFIYQDDPAIDTQGSQVRNNETYYLNYTELGLRHNLSTLTYLDTAGSYSLKRYTDDKVAAESDEDRANIEGMLWHQLSRSLATHGEVGYAMYGYDSSIGLDRDFDVLLGAVGLEKVFSPELRGGIDVGAQAVEYSSNDIDSEVFPYATIDATLAPVPSFRISGAVSHGVRDADVYPFASQEYTEFRGSAEVDASEIVTLGLDATLRDSEYDEDTRPVGSPAPLPGKATSGNETTLVIGGQLTWKLRETARLLLRQVYEDVDSDVEESFQKNTSSVEVHVDF